MDGLLIIDKPVGMTSHDVVARVRRALGERRVGHTGTLDPGASGVLPLVLGRATRLARFLSATDKTYETVVRLGVETDTYDADGRIVSSTPLAGATSIQAIDRALDRFRGTFLQRPPLFSAKKIHGRPLYTLVRSRQRSSPEEGSQDLLERLTPVPVTAHAIEIIEARGADATLRIDCSSGFYVRALAHDLGAELGIGGHVVALRRIRSGEHTIAEAVCLSENRTTLAASALDAIIPLSRMLPGLAGLVLNEHGRRLASCGRDLRRQDFIDPPATAFDAIGAGSGAFRLVDEHGELVAVAERAEAPGLLHPSIVLM
jgi:tRNA pseudouridine55 synthase